MNNHTISTVIAKLQMLKDEHGDLEVCTKLDSRDEESLTINVACIEKVSSKTSEYVLIL